MNWTKASAIAETLSSVAILITLVYLVVEIQQNAEATQAETRQAILDSDPPAGSSSPQTAAAHKICEIFCPETATCGNRNHRALVGNGHKNSVPFNIGKMIRIKRPVWCHLTVAGNELPPHMKIIAD